MCQLKSRATVWSEWLPSFGIVRKDGKEKQPHLWEILMHWCAWKYFNSPYSSQHLGRSWAQGPPQPCCLRNLVLAFPASQHAPGSPLQAHCCLAWGVSKVPGLWVPPGVSPSSYHTLTCSGEAAKKQREEMELPGSLRELWLPYRDVSQCCLLLPLSPLYLKFDW